MSLPRHLFAFVLTALAGVALSMPLVAASRDAATPAAIAAVLSNDGTTIEGTVRFHLHNDTGKPLGDIPVWLYPNRFALPSDHLSDRDLEWIYPHGKSSGSMALGRVTWNGGSVPLDRIAYEPLPAPGEPTAAPRVIARIPLGVPMAPGTSGMIELDFTVKIPERRGRFGRHNGVVTLGGGWFPRPLADLTAKDPSLPMEELHASVRVAIPAHLGALLHDRVFAEQETAQTIAHPDIRTDAITLVIMDRMVVTTLSTGRRTLLYVNRENRLRPPVWKDTRGRDENGLPRGLPDLGRRDYPGRAVTIARQVEDIAEELGLQVGTKEDLVLVEVPAWDQLVQTGSGPILLSDRMWRLFNSPRVLSFHDVALARQVATTLARTRSGRLEPLYFRDRAGEMLGDLLAELYARRAHGGGESVNDLVGFAAFIPYIDNLLYAPQIPFREAFSRSVEIPETLRDEPSRFMNDQPRGRRILGKLVDRWGWETVIAMATDAIRADRSLRQATSDRLGDEAPTFWRQWMGAYPSVNYRITGVTDRGKRDGGYTHQVTLRRDGENLVEPVVVEMVDDDGTRARKTWVGDGAQGTVAWDSGAKIDTVNIDPEGRLAEDPTLTEDHPLADNRDPLPWRPPMITQLLVWGDAVTFEPFVLLSFSMRKLYDVSNSYRFYADYTPRGYGASLRYLRHFGNKTTLNSRTWYAGPFLAIRRTFRVETEDLSIPPETIFAATLGSIGAVLGMDTREYAFDPRAGGGFSTWLGYMAGRADDGHFLQSGKISVIGTVLRSAAIGHTFVLTGGVASTLGEAPAVELVTLSDRTKLRAFGLDETYGRVGLYTSGEYRHTLAMGTPVDLPASTHLFKLQGVLFAGAGTISWPGDYTGMFAPDRIFVEVGYGLRAHFLILGALQYMLALDLAIPIYPQDRVWRLAQDNGEVREIPREPFKLVFGITQTY